jgi:hypothetical protein
MYGMYGMYRPHPPRPAGLWPSIVHRGGGLKAVTVRHLRRFGSFCTHRNFPGKARAFARQAAALSLVRKDLTAWKCRRAAVGR